MMRQLTLLERKKIQQELLQSRFQEYDRARARKLLESMLVRSPNSVSTTSIKKDILI